MLRSTADDTSFLEVHRVAITWYCQRLLGSAVDADDAAQETMVRAWQALHRFEGRSSIRSWLYRIATNVCVDVYKRRRRRPELLDLSSDGIPAPASDEVAADPAEVLVRRESVRHALVVAFGLPPRQRTVLMLREVHRLSAAEVAEMTGMSVAAVNSSLQRARASLQLRRSCQLGVVAGLTQDLRRLLHGTAGLGQRLVGGRTLCGPLGDGLLQHVEGQVVELGADRLESFGEFVVSAHGRTASATRSTGWRASTPAAARCMTQPGLAEATTVAPDRSVAAAIAPSLRSLIALDSSGWSAE